MSSEPAAAPDLQERLRRLNQIGAALSVERDLDALLDRILLESRRFTSAEAGTLFLVEEDHLRFVIAQNDGLQHPTRDLGMPAVPKDKESASGYVALTGQLLNIKDVYCDERHHFVAPRRYDQLTGYRTRSMLVVPMRNHEDQIIGVLQLINALGPDRRIIPFPSTDEPLIESLASQAAVAINNVRLIQETENLFGAFVQVMATAIDERFPHTGGHIRRVTEMAMVLARAVDQCSTGPLADVRFSTEEFEELRLASWLHDIGKISTPEWLIEKATKLTAVNDDIAVIRLRFALARRSLQVQALEARLEARVKGGPDPDPDQHSQHQLAALDAMLKKIEEANIPTEDIDPELLASLKEVQATTFDDGSGLKNNLLTNDELARLSIRRGNLTPQERAKIQDHAAVGIRLLEQIPFTRKLARVPAIAGAHHERLDGSGYPCGTSGQDLGIRARILALVDIFESLSADDRPYRARPLSGEQVLDILRQEVERGGIDQDLFELFVARRLDRQLAAIKARTAANSPESPEPSLE
ncbi:MAG: GAF domain-containing protein [Candidatus Latescibacteria bacterium]|nr:GAF domain-containing protein [Candidatus Latescibacterota bacterium]